MLRHQYIDLTQVVVKFVEEN